MSAMANDYRACQAWMDEVYGEHFSGWKRADVLAAWAAATAHEREWAAKVAESEPQPDGPMPEDFANLPREALIRAAVNATKKRIAARIREGL